MTVKVKKANIAVTYLWGMFFELTSADCALLAREGGAVYLFVMLMD
jgi:hypothetical protein